MMKSKCLREFEGCGRDARAVPFPNPVLIEDQALQRRSLSARLQAEWRWVVGLGGDDGARGDRDVVGAFDVEGLDHCRQDQGGLRSGRIGRQCTLADRRRTADKRNDQAAVLWAKTARVQDFGLRPQPAVAMQNPGGRSRPWCPRAPGCRRRHRREALGAPGRRPAGRAATPLARQRECKAASAAQRRRCPARDRQRLPRRQAAPGLWALKRADRVTRTTQPPSSRGRLRSSSPPGRPSGRAETRRCCPGRLRLPADRTGRAALRPSLARGDDRAHQLQPAAPEPPAEHISRARDRWWQQKVQEARPAEMRGVTLDQIA
jgi:hypothetical protein